MQSRSITLGRASERMSVVTCQKDLTTVIRNIGSRVHGFSTLPLSGRAEKEDGSFVSTSGPNINHNGDKSKVWGERYLGHYISVVQRDIANISGVERVEEASRARRFVPTQSRK